MNKSSTAWPYQPLPFNPDAHIITNVGQFKQCRQDRFCRCRKCKPPITSKGERAWTRN